ncbi:MAG: hypothetical protein KF794_11735 [Xanthobacteraceae bacterium]|nr:hypothetical protein [Xanthobacteraceae bacterium]QYK44437.1 MAG: hypothetical protein KF794_11735 [Xanthobacteraceae bacterium]
MRHAIAAAAIFAFAAGMAHAEPAGQNQDDPLRALIEKSLADSKLEQHPAAETDWSALSDEAILNSIAEQEKTPDYFVLKPVQSTSRALPSKFELNRGQIRVNVEGNVTTASYNNVIPVNALAGTIPGASSGGTGQIRGRVEYVGSSWQFFGGTNRSVVANDDGTLSIANAIVGGTYYKLPQSLWGGKIGTAFEVNPYGDAKTRLEYRQKFGSDFEGFLSAERTTPWQVAPSSTPVNPLDVLRAGVTQRF